MWNLWNHRNHFLNSGSRYKKSDVQQVLNMIVNYLLSGLIGELCFLSKWGSGTVGVMTQVVPLLERCWKLNVDASWSNRKKFGRLGWIIRDYRESPIHVGYELIDHGRPINTLECEAIKMGFLSNHQGF